METVQESGEKKKKQTREKEESSPFAHNKCCLFPSLFSSFEMLPNATDVF